MTTTEQTKVIDVNYGDVVRRATITVRMNKPPIWRFRSWLGMRVVQAGILIFGVGYKREDEEE